MGLLWQQATNDNHGNLPPSASLFIYTINGQPYKHGDTIEWGIMQHGTNSATVRVVSIYAEPINVSFLNGTMPKGWEITVTNNNTELGYLDEVILTVMVAIPETEQGTEFNWETTIRATEATST